METLVSSVQSGAQCFSTVKEQPQSEFKFVLDASGWIMPSVEKHEADGRVVSLLDDQGQPVAAVFVSFAKSSCFQKYTQLPIDAMDNTLAIDAVWVDPKVKLNQVLPVALYFALRSGRIRGMANVVTLIAQPNTGIPIATLMQLESLSKVPVINVNNQKMIAVAGRIKYSMVKLLDQFYENDRSQMPDFFADEVVATYKLWLQKFFNGSWARSIIDERISKEQYICSLYNLHQYVKFTTRICSRCIAHSDEGLLRNHYIHHLKGEINHELIIESDLRTLDADVDYLKTKHVPTEQTNEFISIQESVIGFKQDPVLLLACPLVAEGVTANMDRSFIDHLHRVIGSWGISEPEKAAKFISSHINFDGGEDGHWLAVVSMVRHYVTDETRLQQFLMIMHTAMNGFLRGFNASVDQLKLWEVTPSTGTVNAEKR